MTALPHIPGPSRSTDPGNPSLKRSDLYSSLRVAAVVLTMLGATWKLSSDAADIRNAVGTLTRDQDALTLRVDGHDRMMKQLAEAMPTAREVSSVDARVTALELIARELSSSRAAADERAKQFFEVTWPELTKRIDKIDLKLDRR